MGYQHPDVSGWTGWLFELLWSFDKPHNLVPSLHVALASLLWPVYARHTQSVTRLLVHVWFTLIIASPLLTLQHHVLDVATGAMLGQFCLFVFRDYPRSRALETSKPNIRVAGFYAIGSAVLGVLAISYGSWLWLLLWPAMSLALIAIAYSRGNSSVFRKSGGRHPISTRIVLGPYLLGVYARLLLYRRRRGAWVLAAPGVYCGRLLNNREARVLVTMGITGVLDLTAEHAESKDFRNIEYLNVPVLDLTAPSPEQLNCATSLIAKHALRGGVYVHCALGISRSVAATTAYARNLVVRADLPGLNKDDVKIEVTDDGLVIRGERKNEHEERGEGFYRGERSYGQFYRLIPLPDDIDTDQMRADFSNGVLEITVPVPEREQRRREIPIGAESGKQSKAASTKQT